MNLAPRPLLLAATAAVALAVAACGGSSPTPTPAPTDEPSPEPVGIVLETTEYKFTPDTFTMKAGEATTITLVNKGVVEHDFTFDPQEFKVQVAIGKTASGTLTIAEPGTYDFWCSVPGHKENGMVGTLTVE